MEGPLCIIGLGIAGTILSMQCEDQGIDFRLIDEAQHSQSSRIAAGLANPVVLKRQKWVADAEQYLPSAIAFYERWQETFESPFYHPIQLEHIFHQPGELNDWQSNSLKKNLQNHLGPVVQDEIPLINSPYGRGALEGVFWVDTVSLIEQQRNRLREKGQLIEANWEDIPDLASQNQVYCNGHFLRESHPEINKAFSPTKGEVMIIEAPGLPEDRMLHAGVFTLPLGNQRFKVGATYSHQNLNEAITDKGLNFLKEKLEVFYKGPYKVLEQKAGVRPNIKDRKPLLGSLGKNQWAFNGLGSRGVLLAPFLSKHFLDFLLNGSPLRKEWDLNRFT